MKSFVEENQEFEQWLGTKCEVVEDDLDYKHKKQMTHDAFTFLRATCFRWSRHIEKVCPDFKAAPAVLSVGDAHLENFGTWRDDEGRLVWGVNDFDEAAVIPYAYDLIRLASSARLARDAKDKKRALEPYLHLDNQETASAFLEGYRKGLEAPRPTILDEMKNTWLRPYVICSDDKRKDFWEEFEEYRDEPIPAAVRAGFEESLPKDAEILKVARRPRKGGGSLGRPRYVALARWRRALLVREAKALLPAAWDWAHGSDDPPRFRELARGKYRSFDPWLRVTSHSPYYIYRRLAADARKVNLGPDTDVHPPKTGMKDVRKLLHAMGFDISAIHAATRVEVIIDDLDKRKDGWLHDAAKRAAEWVTEDYKAWQKHLLKKAAK